MSPSDSVTRSNKAPKVNDDEASDTPFLDSTEPNTRLANFNRPELDLGKFLGRGRFTETREIRKVDRDLRYRPASIGEEKARMEVYENTKTKGRCNFCVKRVRKDLKTEREIERAALGLTIEANYLSRLVHSNILQLKGMCTTSIRLGQDMFEYHAIVTSRITETLDERIDYWNAQDSVCVSSDFILHLKTDYAFQIADALHYLHERRIVFRNLTLSSIGFTTNDTIQLINFDCVREIPQGETSLNDGFKGNPNYMAPEMHQGQKYNAKVDCFAWAICFYEMLTQTPAFECNEEDGQPIRHNGWHPSLQNTEFVPDGLLDLIEDAWETDPDDRVTMKDIRAQLEWILFGDGDEDNETESKSCTSRRASITSIGSKSSWGLGMEDFSALGLDLEDSENFDMCDGDAIIHAALGFSGTRSSFIPENLLLDAQEAAGAPLGPPPPSQAPQLQLEEILPKIEYTKQYRGLRLETIPPLSFVPPNSANKAGRRRSSIQRTENAPCA